MGKRPVVMCEAARRDLAPRRKDDRATKREGSSRSCIAVVLHNPLPKSRMFSQYVVGRQRVNLYGTDPKLPKTLLRVPRLRWLFLIWASLQSDQLAWSPHKVPIYLYLLAHLILVSPHVISTFRLVCRAGSTLAVWKLGRMVIRVEPSSPRSESSSYSTVQTSGSCKAMVLFFSRLTVNPCWVQKELKASMSAWAWLRLVGGGWSCRPCSIAE